MHRHAVWRDMTRKPRTAVYTGFSSKVLATVGLFGFFVTVYIYNQFPEASAAPAMDLTRNVFDESKYDAPPKAVFTEKIVHLDLKGAPPSLAYFKEFFPFIKKYGATGLLIEYEDTFPYTGELGAVPAGNAYSTEEIRQILHLAKINELEVIPLIQTFGHLEFVLKLEEYSPQREIPDWHQVICPSRNSSVDVLKAMLKQIGGLHPDIKRMHIGSDEVYNFGECSDCTEKMQRNSWEKSDLFLNHVHTIASFIKNELKLIPMMWDDEFRNQPEHKIRQSGLGDLVEIVVWQYSQHVLDQLRPEIFTKYTSLFKNIWAASAFKGATGADMFMTSVSHHLANHRSWIDLALSYKEQVSFKGIVITGWQRYDHFSVLCELLPVGTPSLITNLMLIADYSLSDAAIYEQARVALKCDGPLVTDVQSYFQSDLVSRCEFPGSDLYSAMQKLMILKRRFFNMKEIQGLRGWLSEYNMKHKYSSPAILDRFVNEINSNRIDSEAVESDISVSMHGVYDNYTISEVLETYLYPVKGEIQKMWDARNEIAERKFFPKRPFL